MVTPGKFLMAVVAGGLMLALLIGYLILRDDMILDETPISRPDGDRRTAATAEDEPALDEDAPAARQARLEGPTDCVDGPFRVRVSGDDISEVTFFVDGRKRRTVEAGGERGEFSLRIDPREQSQRVHRVRADARFSGAGASSLETTSLIYQRCPQTAPVVRFTR